jgi:hypothetical protein
VTSNGMTYISCFVKIRPVVLEFKRVEDWTDIYDMATPICVVFSHVVQRTHNRIKSKVGVKAGRKETSGKTKT